MNIFQTVIIIGATGFFLTAMLFLAVRRIPEANKGIGWWAIASIAACMSYIGVLLTTLNGLQTIGGVLNSVLMVVWVVALYFGGAGFNNRKINWRYMCTVALLTISSILYFNFVQVNIVFSAISTQLFCGVILFKLALMFFKNKVQYDFLNKALVATFIICGLFWQSYVVTFVYEPYKIPGFFAYALILFAIHFFLAFWVIEQIQNRMVKSEKGALKASREKSEALVKLAEAKGDAEAANRLKGEFLNIVSHDLKTTISGTLLFSKVIRKNLYDHHKVLDATDSIERFNNQMNTVIENLLDVTRLENNEYEFFYSKIDILKTLSNSQKRFEHLANEKNIKLFVDESLEEIFVYVDNTAIEQVFDNLISNAIKFSKPKSQVFIRIEIKDNTVFCHIKDQGLGLTTEDQKVLFKKFVNRSAKPTSGESSTGLGLSIVKRLVESMAGKINAESKGEGLGTDFIVTLPLYKDT